MEKRVSARLVILNSAKQVLLFHSQVPGMSPFWAAPGGRPEKGESLEEALNREASEELGLALTAPLPEIWVCHEEVQWGSEKLHLEDHFFLVQVESIDMPTSTAEVHKAEGIDQHRWWSVNDIEASNEPVYPPGLANALGALLTEGPPDTSLDISPSGD
jgi:8-oxo-dGTP pyrophosphatase MutT (NUDIX family)